MSHSTLEKEQKKETNRRKSTGTKESYSSSLRIIGMKENREPNQEVVYEITQERDKTIYIIFILTFPLRQEVAAHIQHTQIANYKHKS